MCELARAVVRMLESDLGFEGRARVLVRTVARLVVRSARAAA